MNAFKQFDVPECISFPYKELKGSGDKLPKNRLLIMADSSGIYSKDTVTNSKERDLKLLLICLADLLIGREITYRSLLIQHTGCQVHVYVS